MNTCPVCHVSQLMIMVIIIRNWGLCTDFLAFDLWLRKTPETSARRPSDEDCAISHRLKWNPLPPNDVCRIAQHIRKGEDKKERVRGLLIPWVKKKKSLLWCLHTVNLSARYCLFSWYSLFLLNFILISLLIFLHLIQIDLGNSISAVLRVIRFLSWVLTVHVLLP